MGYMLWLNFLLLGYPFPVSGRRKGAVPTSERIAGQRTRAASLCKGLSEQGGWGAAEAPA